MEQRTLGGDGPAVSVVGLGCNNFGMKIDADATREVVHAALDVGITHFDTAEMYGGGKSEEFLAAALGDRRDEVVVASKFLPRPRDEPYTPGVLRQRIVEGCEISLQRLGTDRIDLYYQHYPDPEAPIDEALEVLTELVEQGKVLHIASSNVDAAPDRHRREGLGGAGAHAVRRHADRVEPAQPGGGERCRAGSRARPGRRRPVLPARIGNAHRQVPAR